MIINALIAIIFTAVGWQLRKEIAEAPELKEGETEAQMMERVSTGKESTGATWPGW